MACHAKPLPTNRIPFEFVGRARAFRNRVMAGEDICIAAHSAIRDAFYQRLMRKPSFRHPECIDLWRRWKSVKVFGQSPVEPKLIYTKKRVEIADFRMLSVVTRLRQWDADAREPGVDLALVRMIAEYKAGESRVEQTIRGIATFSLHALARYYQRAFNPSDEALIAAMWGVLSSAYDIIHSDAEEFTLPVRSNGGNWWGRVVTGHESDLESSDFDEEKAVDNLDIRTFFTDDDRAAGK